MATVVTVNKPVKPSQVVLKLRQKRLRPRIIAVATLYTTSWSTDPCKVVYVKEIGRFLTARESWKPFKIVYADIDPPVREVAEAIVMTRLIDVFVCPGRYKFVQFKEYCSGIYKVRSVLVLEKIRDKYVPSMLLVHVDASVTSYVRIYIF